MMFKNWEEVADPLKPPTGQDVTDEQARLAAVAAHTHELMAAELGGVVS